MTLTTPTLRKATARDAQALWDLRRAAILDGCADHYALDDLKRWTQASRVPPGFVTMVDKGFFLMEADSQAVAMGMVDLESGRVDGIFVAPGYGNQGLGKAIMALLERRARHAGLASIHLDATLNAAPFYRRLGFVGDEIAHYQSPVGVSLDCVPMIKPLEPGQ